MAWKLLFVTVACAVVALSNSKSVNYYRSRNVDSQLESDLSDNDGSPKSDDAVFHLNNKLDKNENFDTYISRTSGKRHHKPQNSYDEDVDSDVLSRNLVNSDDLNKINRRTIKKYHSGGNPEEVDNGESDLGSSTKVKVSGDFWQTEDLSEQRVKNSGHKQVYNDQEYVVNRHGHDNDENDSPSPKNW